MRRKCGCPSFFPSLISSCVATAWFGSWSNALVHIPFSSGIPGCTLLSVLFPDGLSYMPYKEPISARRHRFAGNGMLTILMRIPWHKIFPQALVSPEHWKRIQWFCWFISWLLTCFKVEYKTELPYAIVALLSTFHSSLTSISLILFQGKVR